MSTVISTLDLSLYGCPMHYIKAREALGKIENQQSLMFIVNNGEALKEIIASLSQDGHYCDVEEQETLTTTVRVTKKL
jgi:TusA-related sulfurtransferase